MHRRDVVGEGAGIVQRLQDAFMDAAHQQLGGQSSRSHPGRSGHLHAHSRWAYSRSRHRCWSLSGRKIRGRGERRLRFEGDEPLAQSGQGAFQRL